MADGVNYISVDDIAHPAGHYSHAARYGDLLFISGQLPGPPQSSAERDDFTAQTRRVLGRVLSILAAAGGGAEHLLKVSVYLTDVDQWALFNEIYGSVMGEARPARIVVPVPSLNRGFLVEVEAIAAIPVSLSPGAKIG